MSRWNHTQSKIALQKTRHWSGRPQRKHRVSVGSLGSTSRAFVGAATPWPVMIGGGWVAGKACADAPLDWRTMSKTFSAW